MSDAKSTELLSAYLDGELPADQRQAVEQMLADRPQLQRLLGDLRSVQGTLQALPRAAAPVDLRDRVMQQVEAARKQQLLDELAPAMESDADSREDTRGNGKPAPPPLPPQVIGQATAPISVSEPHAPSLAELHTQRRRGDRMKAYAALIAVGTSAAILLAVLFFSGIGGPAPVAQRPDAPAEPPREAINVVPTHPAVPQETVPAPSVPAPKTATVEPGATTPAEPSIPSPAPTENLSPRTTTQPPAVANADNPPKPDPSGKQPVEVAPTAVAAARVGSKPAAQLQGAGGANIPSPGKGPFGQRFNRPGFMLTLIDTNADGRISDPEMQYAVRIYQKLANAKRPTDEGQQLLKDFDKDKDEALSESEATEAVVQARLSLAARGRIVADFCNSIDTNGDGLLTPPEFDKLAGRLGASGQVMRAKIPLLFERVDRDGGGGINLAESQLYADAFVEFSGLVVDHDADASGLLPSENALATVKRTLMMLDANKDHQISRREARNDPNLRGVFEEVDLNEDAQVSEGEMFDYLKMKLPAVETPKSFSFRISAVR